MIHFELQTRASNISDHETSTFIQFVPMSGCHHRGHCYRNDRTINQVNSLKHHNIHYALLILAMAKIAVRISTLILTHWQQSRKCILSLFTFHISYAAFIENPNPKLKKINLKKEILQHKEKRRWKNGTCWCLVKSFLYRIVLLRKTLGVRLILMKVNGLYEVSGKKFQTFWKRYTA